MKFKVYRRKPVMPLRRFKIQYFMRGNESKKPITVGFSASIIGLRGTIARHLARDDWYPKAIVIDRTTNKVVLTFTRTTTGITIKEGDV